MNYNRNFKRNYFFFFFKKKNIYIYIRFKIYPQLLYTPYIILSLNI